MTLFCNEGEETHLCHLAYCTGKSSKHCLLLKGSWSRNILPYLSNLNFFFEQICFTQTLS